MTKRNCMFATLSVLLFGLSVRFAMLTALLLIGLANVASAGNISLGSAKDFTVLELGEKALSINSNSVIFGDVGKKKGGDKFFNVGFDDYRSGLWRFKPLHRRLQQWWNQRQHRRHCDDDCR